MKQVKQCKNENTHVPHVPKDQNAQNNRVAL